MNDQGKRVITFYIQYGSGCLFSCRFGLLILKASLLQTMTPGFLSIDEVQAVVPAIWACPWGIMPLLMLACHHLGLPMNTI